MLPSDFQFSVHRAERPKFGAPLLLIHGLWTGPWIWQSFAAYLGHRGWSSYAVDLHSSGKERHWKSTLEALQRAVDLLESTPVIIGHDAGALLAFALPSARAAVGLAPLIPGEGTRPHPILRSARACVGRLFAHPLRPSRSQATNLLGVPNPSSLVPEAVSWVDELARIAAADLVASHPPRLIVAAGADAIVDPDDARRLAGAIGADFTVQESATHAMPFGTKWEAVVSDVHRWIVQRLGEPLLLLRGDEDLRDD